MPAKALDKEMHLSSPVDDGELGKWVLAKAREYRQTKDTEGLCVSKVHGNRINNQCSGIYELNTCTND